MPLNVGASAAGNATGDEIMLIVDGVPHEELAFQFDLAAELESEDIRRRPDALEMPIFWHTFE